MRKTAITLVLAFALGSVGWLFLQPRLPEGDQSAATLPQPKDDQMTLDLNLGFPGAPADVAAIATDIMQGKVPDAGALQALGREKLNASWSHPFPQDFPTAGHSLLRQAVVSMNLNAAKALVAAGADPFYNGNELPFQAIKMSTGTQSVWYPDYALGTEFLSFWLTLGGGSNAECPLWLGGPILYSVPSDNLEAVLFLIKAGADPWFNPTPPDDPNYFYDNFYMNLANASRNSTELAFRIAEQDLYRRADPEKAAALIAAYEAVAEQYKTASGPEDLRDVWGLQMALKEILPQLEVSPTGAIAEMMAVDVPPDIGGFFLAKGELRSPFLRRSAVKR